MVLSWTLEAGSIIAKLIFNRLSEERQIGLRLSELKKTQYD